MMRQYSPPLLGILAMPAALSIANTPALTFLAREVLSGSGFGLFFLMYPMFFLVMLFAFGPAFSFLYWSARLCLGEGGEINLPSATRESKRSGFSTGMRPATLVFATLPLVLLALIIVRGNMNHSGTDLEAALNDGRRGAVLKSLNAGLSVEHVDPGKETPLFEAARTGDAALAEALLSRGANVNAQSRSGHTPLMWAAMQNHNDLASMLLDRGAAVNAADNDGRTALIDAAMRGNLAMAQLLLKRGADTKPSDVHGKTALAYAEEEGHGEIAAQLRR